MSLASRISLARFTGKLDTIFDSFSINNESRSLGTGVHFGGVSNSSPEKVPRNKGLQKYHRYFLCINSYFVQVNS